MATDPKSPRPFEDLLAQTRWLGGLAAQLVPPADRDDLIQDVLVSAMCAERPKHLRGWLSTVARNLAARRRSRERNRRSRERTVARHEASEPSAADALESFATHRAVVNAVMDLEEPCRTAVLLRFWEDLPPREVARRTGVPVETARTRIKRGVDRLRAQLDQQSGSRHAWVLPLLEIAGVREAFLAGGATAGTGVTMASPSILTGALAMKKAALATIVVASVVATVAVFTYGDSPVDEWRGSAGGGTSQGGATTASATKAGGEGEAPAVSDRTALEGTPADATNEGELVVTVRGGSGEPVAGASVWRWRDFEPGKPPPGKAEQGTTDAQGQARLPSSSSAGGIVVLARDHVVEVRRLPSLTGEHEVSMQAGVRVQGWIRVDGEEPAEPIRLRLWDRARGRSDPLQHLPDNLRQSVRDYRQENHRVLETTAHGAFEFTGLAADWHGSIRLPRYLWFQGRSLQGDGGNRYEYRLTAPKTGLQLETAVLPGLRGRVVWDDNGQGIPKAEVGAIAVLASGEDSVYTSLHTEEDGSFRVGFVPPSLDEQREWPGKEGRRPIRKISLRVYKAGARKAESEILDPEKLDPPGRVEIRLQRAAKLHFLAVDPAGQPVPGAVVKGARRSGPSDSEGLGTVEVEDLDRRRFLAAAPGHVVAEVEARRGAGTPESPLELVLARANKIVVVVRDTQQRPPQGLYVSVRSKQPLFTGSKAGLPTELHGVVGTWYSGGLYGHGKMRFEYPVDESGEIVLASLRPGVPFELALLDKLEQEVLVRGARTPPGGGAERIELRLAGSLQDFTGLVVDHRGRPIAGAQILAQFEDYGKGQVTDPQGRFRFEDTYPTGKPFTLKVSHRGHVRTERKGVAITKGMEPVMIQLLPGHDVNVTFVDPEGARLPVKRCEVVGNIESDWDRLEPGLLLVKDLPAGPQVFQAYLGGRTYELRHDPAASNVARFVVPAMGRIQVDVPRPEKLNWHEVRAVITARSDGKSFQAHFIKCADEPTMRTSEELLLPGEYTVEVRARADDGEGRLLHPARQVRIQPGKVSRCPFGR